MNRLVQGDVGSGKTIVAFMCMLFAIEEGTQVAFMAPTEVLAYQHYKSLKKYGLAIFANSHNKILEVINTIAPEHLELNLKNYKHLIESLAGTEFSLDIVGSGSENEELEKLSRDLSVQVYFLGILKNV